MTRAKHKADRHFEVYIGLVAPVLACQSVVIPMSGLISRPIVALAWIQNAYGDPVLGWLFNKKMLYVGALSISSLEGRMPWPMWARSRAHERT